MSEKSLFTYVTCYVSLFVLCRHSVHAATPQPACPCDPNAAVGHRCSCYICLNPPPAGPWEFMSAALSTNAQMNKKYAPTTHRCPDIRNQYPLYDFVQTAGPNNPGNNPQAIVYERRSRQIPDPGSPAMTRREYYWIDSWAVELSARERVLNGGRPYSALRRPRNPCHPRIGQRQLYALCWYQGQMAPPHDPLVALPHGRPRGAKTEYQNDIDLYLDDEMVFADDYNAYGEFGNIDGMYYYISTQMP